jgi:hypothetical protein
MMGRHPRTHGTHGKAQTTIRTKLWRPSTRTTRSRAHSDLRGRARPRDGWTSCIVLASSQPSLLGYSCARPAPGSSVDLRWPPAPFFVHYRDMEPAVRRAEVCRIRLSKPPKRHPGNKYRVHGPVGVSYDVFESSLCHTALKSFQPLLNTIGAIKASARASAQPPGSAL